jgi:hypothetical protein
VTLEPGDRVRTRAHVRNDSRIVAPRGSEGIVRFVYTSHEAAVIEWGEDALFSASFAQLEKIP